MALAVIVSCWLGIAGVLNYADQRFDPANQMFNWFSMVWLVWPAMLCFLVLVHVYEGIFGFDDSGGTDDE